MSPGLHVVRAGALTTVQDEGRTGWAHLGVPRAGALDAPARRLANRLVGNAPDAAVLETTLTGCAVRLSGARSVTAVVGGAGCRVTLDGRPVAWGVPVRVPDGAVLEAGPAVHGLRAYLAFGGGLVPEPVLGSRSADLLSGLGPPVLRDGDVLPLGPARPCPAHGAVPWPGAPAELVLPCTRGPGTPGSRRRPCARSPPPRTGSRSGATASDCAPRARPCGAPGTANCPARGSCWAPSRCRRTGGPWCS